MWFLVALLACTPETPPPPPAPAPAEAPAPAATPGPANEQVERTWDAELAEVDRRILYFQERAESPEGDRLAFKQVISLLLDRAQLTGDYGDYARAQALIDGAFDKAEAAANGPHASAFALDMALHRYASAKEHLAFIEPSAGPTAQLDFALGNYEAAGAAFERMAKSQRPEHLSRLAIYRWKTGDLDGGDALLADAAAGYHGRFHRPEAWYHLHRGIFDLERGAYHDAMAHYLTAKEKLEGYWLIDEHIAEIHLLQGNLDKARAMYEDLVERTGNPEFMDRLAETLEQQGHDAEAERMVAKARAAYEARLEQFPEATWGHAIDHWITWGDPAEALAMARKNHANRPNGDAKLALVHALMKAGELAEARTVMKDIQASPFDVPEVTELAEALKKAK
jgi:hypothetical protein